LENTPLENTPLEKRLAKQEAKSVSGVKGVEIRKIFYFANQ
jgi:hypothetical protein